LEKYSVIEWGIRDDLPAFVLREIETGYEWPLMTNLKNGNLEVIGNIHENPELIKESKRV